MIEPYYSDDHVTIYHGDCLEVLQRLDLQVGMVLTSPPYNKGQPGGVEWTRLDDGYGQHDDAMPHDEYVRWQRAVVSGLWASLSDDGAIYYQHKPMAKGPEVRLPLELLPPEVLLRQIITWDRGSGFQRQFTHYVPSYEWILLLAKPAFRITTKNVDDVWRIAPTADPDHPASFPLKLARRAVSSTCASVVLDPFMGSGTTLRAAKDMGRKAIGIELEERYCELAAKRLAQEVLALEGV